MKASELIDRLQQLVDDGYNLPVVIFVEDSDFKDYDMRAFDIDVLHPDYLDNAITITVEKHGSNR